jgi:hypothetical protein
MKHFLNGVEISPRNRSEIGIVSDFSENPDVLKLSTDSVVLPREAFDIVKQHIQTQGIFEGIPYEVQLDSGVNLEMYVDLTDGVVQRLYDIEVKLKKRKGQDDFFDKANGTTFDLMLSKNVQFNFEMIDYFVIPPDRYAQAVSLSITLFIMGKELAEATKELASSISELVQAVTLNAGVPPSVDTGDIIALSIKATARFIYFLAILSVVIDLATRLIQLLFPPKRKFKGCKIKELISKGCQHLGFTFQSTLFDAEPQWTLLPVPIVKKRQSIFLYEPAFLNNAFTKGTPSVSDSVQTLGELIEAVELMFNAKTKVNNGVVRIERRDWWENQTSLQLQPALSLQSDRNDEFEYNVEDSWKRYFIRYQSDFSDLHTIDGEVYDNSLCEFSTEPLNVVNADLVSIKGLQEVAIPFSLGARKGNLDWFEVLGKGCAEVIDAVTGVFGGGTNFAQQITDRKDCLQISQMYYSQTKILWCVNGKQPSNYFDKVSALSLWNRFHYINQIQLNDYIVKNDVRIRLTGSNFVSLQDNNFAEIDGVLSEILKCDWIDEKNFCKITYKQRLQWSNGKVTTIRIDE